MELNKFQVNKELEVQIPSVGFEITKEQFESIKNKTPTFYETDGQKLFEIKEDGIKTGKYMAYLIWK